MHKSAKSKDAAINGFFVIYPQNIGKIFGGINLCQKIQETGKRDAVAISSMLKSANFKDAAIYGFLLYTYAQNIGDIFGGRKS